MPYTTEKTCEFECNNLKFIYIFERKNKFCFPGSCGGMLGYYVFKINQYNLWLADSCKQENVTMRDCILKFISNKKATSGELQLRVMNKKQPVSPDAVCLVKVIGTTNYIRLP